MTRSAKIIGGMKSNETIPITEFLSVKMASFKFEPTTSCDVERLFSMYKSFLRSNRHGTTVENIKYYMILHLNK